MQVKRFVAENMRLALQMVKEEVGSEAIILSSKRVAEGVEILTTTDPLEPQSAAVGGALKSAVPSANPFQSEELAAHLSASQVTTAAASKLELGLEQMQQDARQRARVLAAALARKSTQEKESLHTAEVVDKVDDILGLAATAGRTQSDAVASISQADLPLQHPVDTKAREIAPVQPVRSPEQDHELSQMRYELQSMRDLLERQLSTLAWGQYSQQNPQQASLWKRLKRMGVTASIADGLLKRIKNSSAGDVKEEQGHWQQLMKSMSRQLSVVEGDLVAKGGVFAFVGPTGAGKTTTIGKLATRYVLENGAENVALVTTDTARIAAHEQLRTFGRILNVPVKVVDKNNSLERVLYSLRHRSLVLVDTAGLNRQDPALKRQLMALNELSNRINTVLVIPTTSQVEVIKANYHTYKTDSLMSCVLTKLDEAASLGGAISLSLEQGLPIAYSSNGQDIPNDLAVANADDLIRATIELAKHREVDDAVMVDEMVSLSRG